MMTNKQLKLLPSIWAILPEELSKLEAAYAKYAETEIKVEEPEAFLDLGTSTGLSRNIQIIDNIGVLKIEGVITPKSDIFTEIFGGAALDVLTNDFKTLLENDDIDTIILDIDSPGGSIAGVATFADMIFRARDEKTIIAHSSSVMASGAMWIAAAAERVLISDNTVATGSIGVLTTHLDFEIFNIQQGIIPTEVVAGKQKRVASQLKPLTSEGRAMLQQRVDHLMDVFVGEVARFKNITTQLVSVNMADGKVFIGDQAVKAGLVDDIISFDLLIETISDGGNDMSNFAKTEANLNNLKEHHSDVYAEAVAVGTTQASSAAEAAEKAGFNAGSLAGAKAENARINGIDACTIIGQEVLANNMKADGKTTPGEAAIRMIAADQAAKATGLEKIKTESAKAVSDELEETIVKNADMTPKEQWEASADLKKEFATADIYDAYMTNKADGNIRVFNAKAAE
jgi:signal peptide peptidase SppA